MNELIEKINAELAAFQKDADAQLTKGNKAAKARVRKATLELEKLGKQYRKESVK